VYLWHLAGCLASDYCELTFMTANLSRKTKDWTLQDVLFLTMLVAIAALSYVLLHR
jgi:hypothetical protein